MLLAALMSKPPVVIASRAAEPQPIVEVTRRLRRLASSAQVAVSLATCLSEARSSRRSGATRGAVFTKLTTGRGAGLGELDSCDFPSSSEPVDILADWMASCLGEGVVAVSGSAAVVLPPRRAKSCCMYESIEISSSGPSEASVCQLVTGVEADDGLAREGSVAGDE